ncbi:hypothetical protein PMAYCL1PPCAC_28802, partial [Pristionchus mayeri]
WRNQKIDIAEGANYMIHKLVGGTTAHLPARSSTANEEKSKYMEKLNSVGVEKRRRGKESEAIKALKNTLLKYSTKTPSDRGGVLDDAADFLIYLAAKSSTGRSSSLDTRKSPQTTSSSPLTPSSTPFPSPTSSVDSGNWSMGSLSPEFVSSLMRQALFTPTSILRLLNTSVSFTGSTRISKTNGGIWRPWE